MIGLSAVVLFCNEEGNIDKLHSEIEKICVQEGCDYEIIFY